MTEKGQEKFFLAVDQVEPAFRRYLEEKQIYTASESWHVNYDERACFLVVSVDIYDNKGGQKYGGSARIACDRESYSPKGEWDFSDIID